MQVFKLGLKDHQLVKRLKTWYTGSLIHAMHMAKEEERRLKSVRARKEEPELPRGAMFSKNREENQGSTTEVLTEEETEAKRRISLQHFLARGKFNSVEEKEQNDISPEQ